MISPEIVPPTSHEFKKGMGIVVDGDSQRTAATVLTTNQKRLGLELSRLPSPALQVGEKVQLIYWDDRPMAYCWQGEVSQIGGPGNRHLMISLLGGKIEQRKFLRFRIPINFSFTVVEASDLNLVGKKFSSETQNISLCGLAFDTFHQLKTGDRLEMDLHLSPAQVTHAVGWVVRSERVQRTEYVGSIVVKTVHSVAVEFFHLTGHEQKHLLQFLLKSTAEA
ncbi:MAG: PilZ domain-containing protein [Acidobacteriota bacterium]